MHKIDIFVTKKFSKKNWPIWIIGCIQQAGLIKLIDPVTVPNDQDLQSDWVKRHDLRSLSSLWGDHQDHTMWPNLTADPVKSSESFMMSCSNRHCKQQRAGTEQSEIPAALLLSMEVDRTKCRGRWFHPQREIWSFMIHSAKEKGRVIRFIMAHHIMAKSFSPAFHCECGIIPSFWCRREWSWS